MTHAEVINLWPSLTAFAEDIGVQYVTAKAMRRRSSIPSPYWKIAVVSARRRNISGVTLDVLADSVALYPEAAE